jgi:hypothetical protein
MCNLTNDKCKYLNYWLYICPIIRKMKQLETKNQQNNLQI